MTKEVESESDQYCDIIVLLFCGTSGLNDCELLGSDESDVVIIAWQLIDININKVRAFFLIKMSYLASQLFTNCFKLIN